MASLYETNKTAYNVLKQSFIEQDDKVVSFNLPTTAIIGSDIQLMDCDAFLAAFKNFLTIPHQNKVVDICGVNCTINVGKNNCNISLHMYNHNTQNFDKFTYIANIDTNTLGVKNTKCNIAQMSTFDKRLFELINKNINLNKNCSYQIIIIRCKHDTYYIIEDASEILGRGSFGTVYIAYNSNGERFAVKFLHFSGGALSKLDGLYREIVVLNNIKQYAGAFYVKDVLISGGNSNANPITFNSDKYFIPNFNEYVSHITNDTLDTTNPLFHVAPLYVTAFLVTEYVNGCSVNEYIGNDNRCSPQGSNMVVIAKKYANSLLRRQIVLAKLSEVLKFLSVIHANGITHLDIKPENIMIENKSKCKLSHDNDISQIKLIDYGFACLPNTYTPDDCLVFKGTADYVFPLYILYQLAKLSSVRAEVLAIFGDTTLFAKVTDMWALFVTVCEVLLINPQRLLVSRFPDGLLSPQKYINCLNSIGQALVPFIQGKSDTFSIVVNQSIKLATGEPPLADHDVERKLHVYILQSMLQFIALVKKIRVDGIDSIYEFVRNMIAKGYSY